MVSVLMVAKKRDSTRDLMLGLLEGGFVCATTSAPEGVVHLLGEGSPDLVLVDMSGCSVDSPTWCLPQKIKEETHLPVIALICEELLGRIASVPGIDDFVVEPWHVAEVVSRARRMLEPTDQGKDLLTRGDLTIDLAKRHVVLRGKLVPLTFREYQLLTFMAKNEGQAFTRDTLLNKVWGYDYFGGDRTVDVHIWRIRSKIDDADRTLIQTVRNVGYAFGESP